MIMSVPEVSGSSGPSPTEETGETRPSGSPKSGGSGKIATVGDLQRESPEGWYKQLMLMAQDLCDKSRRDTAKLIQEMKKQRAG
jgi:hypothetical protein